MAKTYTLGLAGESFKNADGSSRQAEIKRCRVGEPVLLTRDPPNSHDGNAIACASIRSIGIGMIASDNAQWLAGIMDKGHDVQATIREVCQAPGTKSRGVVIDFHVDGGSELPEAPKGPFARLFGR